MNVIGEPVDEAGPVKTAARRGIHQDAPPYVDQSTEAQILVTGVEDPDSRAHSANESLHIGDFQKAIVAEALLLARINSTGL
jgi:F-type H+-transporting ATPase subunit beta